MYNPVCEYITLEPKEENYEFTMDQEGERIEHPYEVDYYFIKDANPYKL